MHRFAKPGKWPESYAMCTQGQRQIGQAGLVWSSVVLCMYSHKQVRLVGATVIDYGALTHRTAV